jgi:SAM-dependent methyltransferase
VTSRPELRRWNDQHWASVWPRREQMTSAVTSYLLTHLAPVPGERILEVGPGAGSATLTLAARLDGGSVTGADISEPLIELARQRARAGAVANATFARADLQHERVPGAPFDAAVSQFGVMFFDEPERAFTNIRAQVVPGGRLAFACWQEVARNSWHTGAALAAFVPAPVAPEPGRSPTGPFTLGDPSRTLALLERAGWTEVTPHPYELTVSIGADVLLDSEHMKFQGVPEADLDRAREAARRALAPLERPDGRYDAPLAFQVFTARSTG